MRLGYWIIFIFMLVLMRDEYGHDRDGCIEERIGWLSGVLMRPRRTVFERGRGSETVAESRTATY